MNIIIDYLSQTDYTTPAYSTVRSTLQQFQVITCTDRNHFLEQMQALTPLGEDTIITFMSHGGVQGISKGPLTTQIFWQDLILAISGLKNGHKLILNLLGVCNSENIRGTAERLDHGIDEIWVSTSTVQSISKAIVGVKANSFEDFHEYLDDVEKDLYAVIRKGDIL